MNSKGGMDDKEFKDYLMNSIVPLYPDAADRKGKRVLIKIDSGPGRLSSMMLAHLRNLGFILYPGVPNTTSVTQETDQSYGLFKSYFRQNLTTLRRLRIRNNKSVNIAPYLVGLLVFGGEDPETYETGCVNAFALAFSKAKCKEAWEKVGAAPCTMACLESDKVRHEAGVKGNPLANVFKNMQQLNDNCCFALKVKGYRSQLLSAKLNQRKRLETPITVPHSEECVKALAKAISHGEKFYVTGGTHYTHDDIFKSGEVEAREIEIKKMEDDRKVKQELQDNEIAALRIIEKQIPDEKLNVAQCTKLLLWKGIKKKDMGRLPEMQQKWRELKRTPAVPFEKWTLDDEIKLQQLKSRSIDIGDTALGRLQATKKREIEAAFISMSPGGKENYIKRLKTIAQECKHDDSSSSDEDIYSKC